MSKTKAQKRQEKQEFIEYEMRGRSGLDRWWGVPGISKPLGMAEDLEDDSLKRLAREYERGLSDFEDGLVARPQPDLTVTEVRGALGEIRREQARREALRERWGAQDGGTNEEDRRINHGESPSYKLAYMLDWSTWNRFEDSALDWTTEEYERERCTWFALTRSNEEHYAYLRWSQQQVAA